MSGTSLRPRSYAEGASKEWLVANGIGGYASTTAVGANTRAYHGLLVAALAPPADRRLLLSSLDEKCGGISLANHQYPGTIHPQGFLALEGFRLDPFPCFLYRAGDARVEKTVFMIHAENTVLIRYQISGQGRMVIRPLVHFRSFHSAAPLPTIRQEQLPQGAVLSSEGKLYLLSDAADYLPDEVVYYSFEYQAERERGLPWRENLLSPGRFELEAKDKTTFSIMASTWRRSMADVEEELRREILRLRALQAPEQRLAVAADSFLVQRGNGRSIIAGYHWFDDWGRDAMISLPGLLLSTGRLQEARAVLRTFAASAKGGVLPNDMGAGSYNTVDASLWFIQAASSYFRRSCDLELFGQLWPSLVSIVRRYSNVGQDFGMSSDGLVSCGPALTWMDARVDGQPVTPRAGKCCEINVLWYSDLEKMKEMAAALDEPWEEGGLAERVKESFQRFWNPERGCLFDVLDPEDASVRPNQVLAAAVPGLLPEIKRRSILDVVTRELLTPYGLRTLSPRDPRYVGRYEGGPAQRDAAYHQGTVWPWLIGPYVDALLSVNEGSRESREMARGALAPLLALDSGGIGTLPEVFDGDPPHRPAGCISQAWSVAEVLRAVEMIGDLR
jgi:predicted glycogen debranching enzyme